MLKEGGKRGGTLETPTLFSTCPSIEDMTRGLTGWTPFLSFESILTKEMALPSALFALDAPVTVRHGPTLLKSEASSVDVKRMNGQRQQYPCLPVQVSHSLFQYMQSRQAERSNVVLLTPSPFKQPWTLSAFSTVHCTYVCGHVHASDIVARLLAKR